VKKATTQTKKEKDLLFGYIKLGKRRARGFRNIKNFINMIRLICGKVKFNYPLKTT